jgi:glycosyltransferase involved in cell wall biosynthesis
MKILYINHYAGGPHYGMEYRPYYLSREWVKAGHEVMVVAASFSHVRMHQPVVGHVSKDEQHEGITFRWYKTPPYKGNDLWRIRNILSFLCALSFDVKHLAHKFKPHLVIASSTYPMDIWPAKRIANLANARLVFEVHDLWPLSPIELGGMSRWNPFIMILQKAEDYAYRQAHVVISMLPRVHEYMLSRRLKLYKLHIVPNGVDPEEWSTGSKSRQDPTSGLLKKFKKKGWKIVGYTGAHGVANALDTLIDAARLLKDEQVAVVLVGDGPQKARLKKKVKVEGIKNVWFFDPVKKDQIPSLLLNFDVAYIGLQRQPLFRFGIAPNKLMDYMMAARPVLMSIDAGNDIVSDAGCGLTVNAEDPLIVADAIKKLLTIDDAQREEMGRRGHAFVLERHTYPLLAQKFLNACGVRSE